MGQNLILMGLIYINIYILLITDNEMYVPLWLHWREYQIETERTSSKNYAPVASLRLLPPPTNRVTIT